MAMTENIIKVRRENNIKRDDLINRLMEMVEEVKDDDNQNGVTEKMVLSNGGILMLAGFNTTSLTLSSLAYNLAQRPELQERIYQEICDNISSIDDIDHQTVTRLTYLDATLKETLRLYPSACRNLRTCSSDVTIKGRDRYEKKSWN